MSICVAHTSLALSDSQWALRAADSRLGGRFTWYRLFWYIASIRRLKDS